MIRLLCPCFVVFAVVATAAAQDAAGAGTAEPEIFDSQSIGAAEDGRLEHAFPLVDTDDLVVVRPHRFGTRELVGLLTRVAANVGRNAPGARLAVGDLSAENGGHLSPHVSHQSGRDVDLGFYVVDEEGRPLPRAAFVRIGEDGTGRNRAGGRWGFDDERNWQLMVALVDDPVTGVQHVLIAAHLRERLMAYGRDHGASEELLERVRLVTHPIRGSENHDDHYHVRIYCSVGDRPDCLDSPPLHPWYDGTPSPDAVLAARVADLRRAAAERRRQQEQQRLAARLRRQEQMQRDAELTRAAALAREPGAQAAAERRREAALHRSSRSEAHAERQRAAELARTLALLEAEDRRRSAELDRAAQRLDVEERARAASLRRTEERLQAAERRRATRERAEERNRRRRLRAREAAAERRLREMQRRAERQLERERRLADQYR